MLSVLSYGRLVARAVLGGLSQTDGRDYSLITASYGFGKDFRKGILKKGMCYGDDACFIARHKTADVLGKDSGLCKWLAWKLDALCARVTFSEFSQHVCRPVGSKHTSPPPRSHIKKRQHFNPDKTRLQPG